MNSTEDLEHRPDWLQEASAEEQPSAPRPQATVPWWFMPGAAATALLLAGLYIPAFELGRMSPGPWQGLLATANPWTPPPFVAYWFSQELGPWLAGGQPAAALLLAYLSILAASAAITLLGAAAQENDGEHPFSALARLLPAMAMSLFFAAHPTVWNSLNEANPGLLSASLALLGLVLLCPASGQTPAVGRLMVAGLFMGLATANDIRFALLFGAALFAEVLFGGERKRIETISALVLGFLVCATWPLFQGLTGEASLAFFLSHALDAAHPMLQPYQWSSGSLDAVSGPWRLPLFLAALGSCFLVAAARHRLLFMLAFGILLMGPLHPTFVQASPGPMGLRTDDGPTLLFLALLFVAASHGLGGLLLFKQPSPLRKTMAAALAGLFLAGTLYYTFPKHTQSPDNIRPMAALLSEGLPENALVVVQDPAIMGYWEVKRLSAPELAETLVLHRSDLSTLWGRRRMAQLPASDLHWRTMPMAAADLRRWSEDLPFYFQGILRTAPEASERYFAGLLLWDFVALNRSKRPIYFAGLEESWLAARAVPEGIYLKLAPQLAGQSVPAFLDALAPLEESISTPGFASLALGLSWAARLQGAPEEALQLAALAAGSAQQDREAEMARIQAMARHGDSQGAATAVSAFWQAWGLSSPENDFLQGAVNQALQVHRASHELESGLTSDAGKFYTETAENLLTHLWQAQELRPLASFFLRASERNPDDLNALYQLAAVQAQLGDFAAADETLRAWANRGSYRFGDIQEQLAQDSRFRLFLEAQRDEKRPPFPDLPSSHPI